MRKRCFVCGELNNIMIYRIEIDIIKKFICDDDCYYLYCDIYLLEEEATMKKIEQRLKDYRKRKEENRK